MKIFKRPINRVTTRILLIIAAAVVGLALVLAGGTNLAVRAYIEAQAREAIDHELDYYVQLFRSGDAETEHVKDPNALFSPDILLLDPNSPDDFAGNSNYYSGSEKTVYEYFLASKPHAKARKVVETTLGSHKYFIGMQEVSISAPEASQRVIVYINASSVYALVDLLNRVMLILLTLSGALAVFAGIRAGRVAENAEARLKGFFANASHELKSPLTSIQGYSEAWLEGLVDGPKAAKVIVKQSRRMNDLVNELLFLSRVESGEYRVPDTVVAVNELLQSAYETVVDTKAGKILHLKYSPDDLQVCGDIPALERALGNLMSNALRYAKSQVWVQCFARLGKVVIEVKDDGPGISPTDLPHVFERFYKGKGGQNGLGLSLALEIVRAHRGQLQASNQEDGGAVFTLSLNTVKR